MINVFYVVSRIKSKFILFTMRLLHCTEQKLDAAERLLTYPADIEKCKEAVKDHFAYKYGLHLANLRDKKHFRHFSYQELLYLHKLANTDLKPADAQLYFHEILRRNLRIPIILGPDGIKKFLATQMLLRAMGIKTFVNRNDSALLIKALGFLCSIYLNKQFRNYVHKKSVSIVGGAPASSDNSSAIDNSDLIARFNCLTLPAERTELFYYRAERLEYMHREGKLSDINHFSGWKSLKVRRIYNKIKGEHVCLTIASDGAFSFGKLNAVPNACIDLIYNGASKINIFNTNLNLSKSHDSSYRPSAMPPVQYGLIFGEHPAFVQFLLLKYLRTLNFIHLEDNEYLSLEWSYRKFSRRFNECWASPSLTPTHPY